MGDINSFFTGATLLAAITYVGYQLKSMPILFWQYLKRKYVFSVHLEENTELFRYLEAWLYSNYKNKYKNISVGIETKDGVPSLLIEQYADTFFIKYKNKKLLVSKTREKIEKPDSSRNAFIKAFSIQGWKAQTVIIELLEDVLKFHKENSKDIEYMYTSTMGSEWTYLGQIPDVSLDSIIMPSKDVLLEDIKTFCDNKKWYIDRGLRYKRGYLFFGPPGNGKTSLCVAIAKKLHKNIYFLNLSDFEKDSQLTNSFRSIPSNSIIVVEDIDRMPIGGEKNISLSPLLNCVDGSLSREGQLIIFTTNNIDKLDPALIRSGRIDVKCLFDNPKKPEVEQYISRFFERDIKLKEYNKNLSMSDIQELCVRNKNDYIKVCEKLV
jgi:chaperone BCS1